MYICMSLSSMHMCLRTAILCVIYMYLRLKMKRMWNKSVWRRFSTTARIVSKSVWNTLGKLIPNFTRKYMESLCIMHARNYTMLMYFSFLFSSWWVAGNRPRRRRRRCRGVRWARVPCRLRPRRQRRRGSGPQVPAVLRPPWVVPPPDPVAVRTVGLWWRIL